MSRALTAIFLALMIAWHPHTVRAEEASILGYDIVQGLADVTTCGSDSSPETDLILFGSYKSYGRPYVKENPVDINV